METTILSSREAAASGFPTNPEEFDADERISFSKLDGKFLLVQDDGAEFEFDEALRRWVPVLDEALLEEQQRAYRVSGVDEHEPVVAARRKRKKEYVNGEDEEGGRAVRASKKPKPAREPRANTAVYVTGLPADATVDEVASVFSRKCGVIAEEIDSGRPRIKLYTDEHGAFKGDALIVFFKPPSVDMAIMLLDDTPLRIDDGPEAPRMRVQAADASYKKVQHGAGEEGGQQQPTTAEGERERERQRTSAREKQKIIRKTQKLDARLADWSDDEPATMMGESSSGGGGSSRWDKVVILKHMFTLEELAEDPAAILDIKEDIREECSKLGEVTNVVLFDLEAEGVASVRFTSADAARACVRLMDGRSFAGQKVEAYISNGQEKFKKSKKKADDHEEEEEDKV